MVQRHSLSTCQNAYRLPVLFYGVYRPTTMTVRIAEVVVLACNSYIPPVTLGKHAILTRHSKTLPWRLVSVAEAADQITQSRSEIRLRRQMTSATYFIARVPLLWDALETDVAQLAIVSDKRLAYIGLYSLIINPSKRSMKLADVHT